MRVLSDFDGVLTDIAHEAARVTNLFLDSLRALPGVDPHAVAELAHAAYGEMGADPKRHGWTVNGRITAFANEDGFIRVNALAACLDTRAARGDAVARPLAAALAKEGCSAFTALAQKSYEQMTRETAAGALKPLDPDAATVLKALLDRGDEVVVVSNSGSERIQQLLRGAGLDSQTDASPARGRLRVRGGARKFILSGEPRTIDVAGYSVPVDRPHYEQILLEELPDVVIGDVFSLDLALPLELARLGKIAPRVLLRRRPYTPSWSEDHVAAGRGKVIDDLKEVL